MISIWGILKEKVGGWGWVLVELPKQNKYYLYIFMLITFSVYKR